MSVETRTVNMYQYASMPNSNLISNNLSFPSTYPSTSIVPIPSTSIVPIPSTSIVPIPSTSIVPIPSTAPISSNIPVFSTSVPTTASVQVPITSTSPQSQPVFPTSTPTPTSTHTPISVHAPTTDTSLSVMKFPFRSRSRGTSKLELIPVTPPVQQLIATPKKPAKSAKTNSVNFPDNLDENTDQKIRIENESIVGTYKHDINIVYVDNLIRQIFEKERQEQVPQLKQEKYNILQTISRPQQVVERKNSLKRLNEVEKQIEEIESGIKEQLYINDVSEWLSLYQKIGPKPNIIRFRKVDPNEIVDPHSEERSRVISNFLEIAGKYTKLDIIEINDVDTGCPYCGHDLGDFAGDIDIVKRCSNCNNELVTLTNSVHYDEDPNQTNMSSKNDKDNDSRTNFYKSMKNKQCAHNVKLPDNLEQILDQYFKHKNIPIGSVIRQLPLNPDNETRGKYEDGINREMMYKVLKATNLSAYYDNIDLIMKEYWEWVPPDWSNIEDLIMRDYDISQRIFQEIKGDRKSSLNREYHQFRLVEKNYNNGPYKCHPSKFKIVSTPEILKYHEEKWAIICQRAGWEIPKPISSYQRLTYN